VTTSTHQKLGEEHYRNLLKSVLEHQERTSGNHFHNHYAALGALAKLSLESPDQASTGFLPIDIYRAAANCEPKIGRNWGSNPDGSPAKSEPEKSVTSAIGKALEKSDEVYSTLRACGLKFDIGVTHNETKGGPGNRKLYRLCKNPLDNDSATNGIVYNRRVVLNLHGGWRTPALVAFICVAFALPLTFFSASLFAFLQTDPSILTGLVCLAAGALTGYGVMPLLRVGAERTVRLNGMLNNADESWLLERGPKIAIAEYSAPCPVCGGEIKVKDGDIEAPKWLVGRCRNSPRTHVYSFDPETLKGYQLT
jgi:hypothetical protein